MTKKQFKTLHDQSTNTQQGCADRSIAPKDVAAYKNDVTQPKETAHMATQLATNKPDLVIVQKVNSVELEKSKDKIKNILDNSEFSPDESSQLDSFATTILECLPQAIELRAKEVKQKKHMEDLGYTKPTAETPLQAFIAAKTLSFDEYKALFDNAGLDFKDYNAKFYQCLQDWSFENLTEQEVLKDKRNISTPALDAIWNLSYEHLGLEGDNARDDLAWNCFQLEDTCGKLVLEEIEKTNEFHLRQILNIVSDGSSVDSIEVLEYCQNNIWNEEQPNAKELANKAIVEAKNLIALVDQEGPQWLEKINELRSESMHYKAYIAGALSMENNERLLDYATVIKRAVEKLDDIFSAISPNTIARFLLLGDKDEQLSNAYYGD